MIREGHLGTSRVLKLIGHAAAVKLEKQDQTAHKESTVMNDCFYNGGAITSNFQIKLFKICHCFL